MHSLAPVSISPVYVQCRQSFCSQYKPSNMSLSSYCLRSSIVNTPFLECQDGLCQVLEVSIIINYLLLGLIIDMIAISSERETDSLMTHIHLILSQNLYKYDWNPTVSGIVPLRQIIGQNLLNGIWNHALWPGNAECWGLKSTLRVMKDNWFHEIDEGL